MRAKLLVTTCVILLCARTAAAQEPRPAPTPFDAFHVNLLITDWKARLDAYAVELQNDPSSHGYIVAYSARYRLPGWPLRRAHAARNYLVNTRGFDPGRVSVFAGDERPEPGFELWVVRAGETLPVKPLDFAVALAGERAPVKLDELFVPTDEVAEIDPLGSDDAMEHFQPLFDYLRSDPSLRAQLIGYARWGERRGADRLIAARELRRLLARFPVAPARVAARGGGARRYRSIEVWLLPPGAEPPRPTPERRPARRRR